MVPTLPAPAACLIAELGDPSRFRDAGALASYVGVVPRLRQSGKLAFSGARGLPLGNARLRHRLWMPTLVAVPKNPWLRAHYERLLAAGKRPKVALVACMRKLFCAIYSVARNRRSFVPHLAVHFTSTFLDSLFILIHAVMPSAS
jgi:transposase